MKVLAAGHGWRDLTIWTMHRLPTRHFGWSGSGPLKRYHEVEISNTGVWRILKRLEWLCGTGAKRGANLTDSQRRPATSTNRPCSSTAY